MRIALCHTFILLALIITTLCTAEAATMLYVSTRGSDKGKGTLISPFATLERARDEVRKMKAAGPLPRGGVTIELRAGIYELAQPFELAKEDSGTADAPVTYRAQPGAEVRIVGGKVITGFKPVTDPAILERLVPEVRGKVLQVDLKAQGLTDYGPMQAAKGWGGSAENGMEVFFADKPMMISRWPNEGFVRIPEVVGGAPSSIRGTIGDKIGMFTYEGDRPKRWVGEQKPMAHGFWFWDWADQRQEVQSIDTEKRVITLKPPYHWFGYRKGQWYYMYNLLSEIDMPGEWFVDREKGILYFLPPAPITSGKTIVSVLPGLVTMKDTSYVTLRGFTMEAARGSAINMTGGTGNRIIASTIRNVGSYAVHISGGTDNGVSGCDIYQTGDGGITLDGGDRNTLTPAGLFADNNHIHHYGRVNPIVKAGVHVYGVGNRVSHNLIDNAPHNAILFGGLDHKIEYNEIHSVCYLTNDAGAIYGGGDWAQRGTVMRYNYLHDISGFEGKGCVGMYLDDMYCGTTMYGNVYCDVTAASFIGGGRDNIIENNIYVDCKPAIHIDARALGWAAPAVPGYFDKLKSTPYNKPPWSERWPQLLTILDDEPAVPKGNVVARNICVGGRWDDIEGKARPYVKFEDNLLDQDPLFVNAAKRDFRLKPNSPAFELGFKAIPIAEIGLYMSPDRATWPVTSKILPKSEIAVAPQARKAGPAAVFKVTRNKGSVTIDGNATPAEWGGATAASAMVIEQGINGEKIAPRSLAWLKYDDKALYVAVDNTLAADTMASAGNTWGQDDAVELAFRNPAAGKDAPIIVLRGYPNGHFESSSEAGAPGAVVTRAAQGVQYKAAAPARGRWVAEWRIPFTALGIDPQKVSRLEFNLSVRKIAGDQWVEWQGTSGATWDAPRAGIIELTR